MTRKTSLALSQFILVVCMLLGSMPAKAQLCTPDSSLSGLGVLPDTLPPACAGSNYQFSATVRIPPDTIVQGQDVEICWNRLDSLQNVPSGINVQCDPSLSDSCKYPGGSTKCALISGTPAISDTGWHEVFIFSTGKGCPVVGGGCPNGSFCQQNVITDTIYIRVDAPITAQVSNDTLLCPGESVQLSASGGSSYSWSPASGLSDTTIPNPIADPSTTTDYKVTVSGGGCPSDFDTVNVARSDLSVDAGSNTSVSLGNNVTLGGSPAVSGGATPYTVNWTPDSNFTSGSSSSDQNPTASFNAIGQFTYTLEVTDDNGCTLSDDITVTVTGGQLTANAGTDDTVCIGSGVEIGGQPTASGGDSPYSYAWSSPGTLDNSSSSNPTASPTSTTTYTVSVVDDNGNTASDDVTVVVQDTPSVNTAPSTSICQGSSTGIGASVSGGATPYNYSWSPIQSLINPNSQNPTAEPISTTTYQVQVSDANGCTGTGTITVSVDPLPNADAGTDTAICQGGAADLSASGGSSYVWLPAGSLDDNQSQSPTATPDSNTTYTVTVQSSEGCQSTDSVNVTVNDNPDVTIAQGDTTISDSVKLELTQSFNSYSWSNGATSQDIWVASQGDYRVTATDNNGCKASDTVTVTITGVDEKDTPFTQTLGIQPNPNTGSFTISFRAEANIEGELKVFNLHGQVLDKQNVTLQRNKRRLQMDLEEQSSGLYYVQLKTKKGVINRKVMIR